MRKRKPNPLRHLPEKYDEKGGIRIRLDELMKEKGVSLNQVSQRAEMERTQLRDYRDGKMQRLDIDILLRLCYVFECDLYDLIEYIPPK